MKLPSLARCCLAVFASAPFCFAQESNHAAWEIFQHEYVLGTSLELKFAAPTIELATAAESAALAEIDRLAKILSGYDATSEFRRWLATTGEPQRVSPELFEVLALFDTWRVRTAGALDASAEVAGQLWKVAAKSQRVPSSDELAAAVDAVRQQHWRLDPITRTATHLTDAPLMLNSFAKSYIIERACTAAMAAGKLSGAVVNLGGDLVVRGSGTEIVGVTDPMADAENDAPLIHLLVQDRAVATSGGYRRGVEIAGHWYSHLIDPRTGRPVDRVRSATVVAPSATDAGALATALCVMDSAEGLRLVATLPNVECLLLMNDGRQLTSPGWSGFETPTFARMPTGVHAAVARPGASKTTTSSSASDAAFELAVNFEIASVGGGRSKRPFLAVWIEDKDSFPVRTLALWFHGARWLPDLRSWNHADQLRAMSDGTQIVSTVSSATRGPGKYTVKWDGKDASGKPIAPGNYTVLIEVAREHGSHQLIRQELDFSGAARHVDLKGNLELSAASLDYRRKGDAP